MLHLPRADMSLLGKLIGSFLRSKSPPELGLADLAAARAVLGQVPPSVLVDPDAAQARLPFDIAED